MITRKNTKKIYIIRRTVNHTETQVLTEEKEDRKITTVNEAQRYESNKTQMVTQKMASNGESADDAAAAQEARDKEVANLVEEGDQAVNKHSLKEAENILQKAWSGLRPDAPDADRLHIRSLVALAEVYYKRGRSNKDEMESYWHYLKSLTLQKMAIELSESAMKQKVSNNIYQWLVERRDTTLEKVRVLEMHVTRSIYTRLMHFKNKEEKEDTEREADQWLNQLLGHCKQRLKDLYNKGDATDQDGDVTETDSSASDKDESESEQKVEETEEMKVDFSKLQTTIQSLIRKMTYESKQQHLQDLKKQIAHREASIEEENEGTVEQEESRILKSITLHRLRSPLLIECEKRDKTSGEDHSNEKKDKLSKTNNAVQIKKKNVTFVHTKPVTRPKELVPPPYQNEFRQTQKERNASPNILRIWKGYKTPSVMNALPDNAPYKLNTFEELSPITEAFRLQIPVGETTALYEAQQKLISPITEDNFNSALADIFARVAETMLNEKNLNDALKMYTLSLGIYQTIPEAVPCMVKMAQVLKQTGIVKCKLGDVVGGSQLMEKSIDIFEKYPDSNVTYNVAKVWYELGMAYMSDQWNSETLFEHVTDTIHSELDDNHIFRNEYPEYTEADSDGDSEGNEECYSVCTNEAITCYTHTYELLNKLRAHGDKQHTDLYAEVLTKLGDCSIMVGNYDQAVQSYEEAMRLFRVTFGSSNLSENAHVLSMMGVANFLLKHYPQAASILECAYLMQHHMCFSEEETNFEVAFTLTMLAITYYMMGQYHRCIQWCIKAYNIYFNMFGENMANVEEKKRWFIILTIFVLGFSYGTLNFHDKAITQLMMAREICLSAEILDRRQIVRIVKSLADVYSAMDDNDNALIYYNEALEYNIGYDEEDAAVLQNQLLNRTAGVHVNMRQYSTAAKYLEQALDVQKNLEDDIKGDLVTVLHQLGQTYALAGDMDKAIECYMECLDDYREEHGTLTAVMCPTLSSLATLCHVKGCLEDGDDGLKMLQMAESYYQEALKMDNSANVRTIYANYLYYQGNYSEALNVLLPVLYFGITDKVTEIAFTGVELAILPDHIQMEIDELEEVFFDCSVLAKFLAVLCYKQLNLVEDADDCLVSLFNDVKVQNSPVPESMLGYVLMEMGLLLEASQSFYEAAVMLDNQKSIAYGNFWICLSMHIYDTMARCLSKFLELANITVLPQLRYQDQNQQDVLLGQGTRDSGYYENKEMDMWTSTETVATVTSQPSESDYHTQEEETYITTSWDTTSKPTIPSTLPLIHKTTDNEEMHKRFENWEETRSLPYTIDSSSQEFDNWELSSTETLETPDAILKSLSDQNYIRNLTNMSFLDGDEGLLTPSTTDDEWTITEEIVDTPAILLSSLKSNEDNMKTYGRRKDSGGGIVTVVETVSKPIVWTSQIPDNDSSKQTMNEQPNNSPPEEWTVIEETVDTPSVILNLPQNTQVQSVHAIVDDDEKNVDKQHGEVVTTPTAIPQTLTGASKSTSSYGDKVAMVAMHDDNDQNDMHEWTVTEEVIETPLEVLLALKNCDTNKISRPQETKETKEDHGEWTVFEEETVETPSSVLQALINRSNDRYFFSSLHDRNNITQEIPGKDTPEDVWTVTEEVVETPAFVIEALMRDKVETIRCEPQVEDEGWITTDEVVETPAYLRQSIMNSSISHQQVENNNGTPEEAASQEEEWITTEEVVETPAYLLQSIMNSSISHQQAENNHGAQNEADIQDSDEWVVNEEVVETPSSVLKAMMERDIYNPSFQSPMQPLSSGSDLMNRHSQESKPYHPHDSNVPYDNKRAFYQSSASQQEEKELDSSDWVVTEESVETPSFILQAMIERAQQRHLVSSTPDQGQVSGDTWQVKGGEEQQESEVEEWITEEITVETPLVILPSLQGCLPDSQHADAADAKEGGGVHVTKTTLSLPISKSSSSLRHSATNTGSRVTNKTNENESYIYEEFDKAYSELANSPYRDVFSNLKDPRMESYATGMKEEFIVETPHKISETIKNNNNREMYTDNGHKNWPSSKHERTDDAVDLAEEHQTSWVTTEEVVSTPLAILQTLQQGREDVPMNMSPSLDMHTSSSETSPEEEQVWVTEETVVETPAVILALLAKCKS